MPLPKIDYPIFTIETPSNKKLLKFRPMLVKEEKILLMGKASEDDADIMLSVKQIVQNCCLEDGFDVESIPMFDMEYFFLMIRANSIQDVIELKYIDNDDEKEYDFKIELKNVKLKYPEKEEMNIKINDDMGIILKYPTVSILSDKEFLNKSKAEDSFIPLIAKCVDRIYDKEKNYTTKDFDNKELDEFLNNLGIKILDKLGDFLGNIPHMEYIIEYKNSLGSERKIYLRNALSHNNLESYYMSIFILAQHHKYSISEIENLIPFERDLYIDLLNKHLAEQAEETRNN